MSNENDPSGIGGWLLALIIILGVIIPSYEAVEKLFLVNATWTYSSSFSIFWTWIVPLLGAGLYAVLAYILLKAKTWAAVKYVIAGIWIFTVFGLLWTYVPMFNFMNAEARAILLPGIIATIMLNLLFAAISTAYLLKSKRVRNTYRASDAETFA